MQEQTRKKKHVTGIEKIRANKEICADKENYAEEEIYTEEGLGEKYVTCMVKGNYVEGRCHRVKQ